MKYVVNALQREQGLPPIPEQAEGTHLHSAVYDLPLEHSRMGAEIHTATSSQSIRSVDLSRIRPEIVCASNGDSLNDIIAREQYRTLRTKLVDTALPNGYKTIMVSSAAPGDGKSLTVLNLAFAFSGVERIRVLVIEADLHRPSLGTLLGAAKEDGAASHYTDIPEAWQSCLTSLTDNVDCLLASTQHSSSTEFLESVAMQEVIAQARTRYDVILIDSPPMLATADPLILIRYCDAALLVVGAEATPIKAARQAAELMAGKLLGCVLNRVQRIGSDGYYKAYYQKPG